MNPLTNVKNIQKLNETELKLGVIGKKSWHDEYKDSAWVFIGGLPYDLSEGDIICVFSQYGEIVNLNLIRDHKSGKSKGFAFICFEDQRSTILTVDNLNGIKILGRTLRVDHVKDYKIPKEHQDDDEMILQMRSEGCAPKIQSEGEAEAEANEDEKPKKKRKKEKKEKKKKKKNEKKRREVSSSSSSTSGEADDSSGSDVKPSRLKIKAEIKQEVHDRDYDRALAHPSSSRDISGERNRHTRSRDRNGRGQQSAYARVKEERRSPIRDDGFNERDRSRSDSRWGGSAREREDINRNDGRQESRDRVRGSDRGEVRRRDGETGYGPDRNADREQFSDERRDSRANEMGRDWETDRYRGHDIDRDSDRFGGRGRDEERKRGFGSSGSSRGRDYGRYDNHARFKDRKRRDR